MKLEAKVGLFVLLAMVALFVLSVKISTFANIGKDGYVIYAVIDNATGLEKNGKVKINGVDSGYINEISLKQGKPVLSLFLFKGVEVSDDSTIIIKQESLLGGKFVEIIYGSSPVMLKERGTISNHIIYSSIDETSNSINDAAEELRILISKFNNIFDDNTSTDLQQTIRNFKLMALSITKTSDDIRLASQTLNRKLPGILDDFKSMTNSIESTSDEFKITGTTINKSLPTAFDKFINIEDNLTAILQENQKPLNGAIVSAENFFSKGEEAFLKIDEFVSKATEAKLELDMKSEYLTKDGYTKTSFVVAYVPSLSNYYLLEIVSGADYSKTDANGSIIKPGLHDKGKYFITAQMGKRYDNVVLRAGIKESSGGVGIDYLSDFDVLKASLDLFDMNAVNDIRSNQPHVTLGFRYRPVNHINFYTGVDNFLSSKTNNFYVGFGINFIDDDLKYLLISASGAVTGGG
ncbi:MAG: phospholipid/cholesterol/gamma-HCH transport system substrate-binding protein [Campylobacterota bacterium]|nr:phospholipid/cholesterol/gamma-HCH transport system substrate-binding protein [Campylobacterota bacterium]